MGLFQKSSSLSLPSDSGASTSTTATTMPLSDQAQHVLRGGSFDARKFLCRTRSTGDSSVDDEADKEFRAKLRIVDAFNCCERQLVHDTLGFIEDKVLGFKAKAGQTDRKADAWNSTYMKVGKLPKYWRAQWIATRFGQTVGWGASTLAAIDERDSNSINYIFDLWCGVTPSTHLPSSCILKDMCDEIFYRRALKLGRANKAWADAALKQDHSIDWSQNGCFKFTKAAEGDMKLVHISNAEVACPGAIDVLSGEVSLEMNCWDALSKITMLRQEMVLFKFFDRGVGPNVAELQNPRGTAFDHFAKDIESEIMRQREEEAKNKSSSVSTSALVELDQQLDRNLKGNRRLSAQQAMAKSGGKKMHNTLVGSIAV